MPILGQYTLAELKAAIDAAITSKTQPNGITPAVDGALRKLIAEDLFLKIQASQGGSTALFPKDLVMVTESRDLQSLDAGKILMLDNDANLTMPAGSILQNGELIIVGVVNSETSIIEKAPGDTLNIYSPNDGSGNQELVLLEAINIDGQTILLPISTSVVDDNGVNKTALRYLMDKVDDSGGSAFTDGGATNTLTFDSSKWYGTSIAPIIDSSILFDLTNAVSGSQAIVYHTGSSEPMYPAGTIKRGIGSYINGQTNILTFTFLNTNEILLDVDMMNPATFPEVNYWLQRGGVASGFLLNALNQFMATIQPMRSKIVRFNPLWGETFASIFVPLIVNTDGSTTPIGNPTDANVGFVEANWNFYGEIALTNSGLLKYISTSFNAYSVAEVGQDDICVALIVKGGSTNQFSYLFTGGGNLRANIHGNVASSQSASFNSSSVASVPDTVGSVRQVLFYNRTKSTEFEVHKNGIKQIVPAPSTAVEDSNLVIGHNSNINIHYIVGGYLISKGLTDTEISLFTGAWNTLIAKIGRI